MLSRIDFCDRQAVDVVAAAREQADDAREDAGLVVHQHGYRMSFDLTHHSRIASGTAGSWLSCTEATSDQNHSLLRDRLGHVLGSKQHLVVGGARRDHWEAVLRLVDADI